MSSFSSRKNHDKTYGPGATGTDNLAFKVHEGPESTTFEDDQEITRDVIRDDAPDRWFGDMPDTLSGSPDAYAPHHANAIAPPRFPPESALTPRMPLKSFLIDLSHDVMSSPDEPPTRRTSVAGNSEHSRSMPPLPTALSWDDVSTVDSSLHPRPTADHADVRMLLPQDASPGIRHDSWQGPALSSFALEPQSSLNGSSHPPLLLDGPRHSLPAQEGISGKPRGRKVLYASAGLLALLGAMGIGAGFGFQLGVRTVPSFSFSPPPSTVLAPAPAKAASGGETAPAVSVAATAEPVVMAPLPVPNEPSVGKSTELKPLLAHLPGPAKASHALVPAEEVPATPEPIRPPPPAEVAFDRGAAASALAQALEGAKSCLSGDAGGVVRVAVTFAPSGRVTQAIVDGPPFAGTPEGSCIAGRVRSASIPAFSGDAVMVRKSMGF